MKNDLSGKNRGGILISRRQFVAGALAAAAAPGIIPASALGLGQPTGPQRTDHDRHVGHGQPGNGFVAGHAAPARSSGCGRRRLPARPCPAGAEEHQRFLCRARRPAEVQGLRHLQRLPRPAGPQRHRRRLGLRARPLAWRGLQPGDRGRQGYLRREADHPLDRRRHQGPRRRAALRLRVPDGHDAAELAAVPPGVRAGHEQLPWQGPHDPGRRAGRTGISGRGALQSARRFRLRHVDRPGAL